MAASWFFQFGNVLLFFLSRSRPSDPGLDGESVQHAAVDPRQPIGSFPASAAGWVRLDLVFQENLLY
jgi:hypothetical protein